jgi:uncharacterized protein (DUF1778 family)
MAAKTARVEARVNLETQALLRRAAELQGRSMSDFVVSAAREAAMETIAVMETLQLSQKAQATFVEQLLNAPEPAPALERARARHESLIGPS